MLLLLPCISSSILLPTELLEYASEKYQAAKAPYFFKFLDSLIYAGN